MKPTLLFIALAIASASFGQNQQLIDSLTNEICISMANSKEVNDSIRVFEAFRHHSLPPAANFTQEEKKKIGEHIYFRLQRNCPLFRTLMERNMPENTHWKTVSVKPLPKLNDNECSEFTGYKKYHYIESSGDTVLLTIDNGFWTDHFKDGSFSKLSVQWLNACEFDIEFIESNNELRKNFSKAGDKYRYHIVEKQEGCYLMSVEIAGQNRYSLFKIYF